jgi:hypothetical protein
MVSASNATSRASARPASFDAWYEEMPTQLSASADPVQYPVSGVVDVTQSGRPNGEVGGAIPTEGAGG